MFEWPGKDIAEEKWAKGETERWRAREEELREQGKSEEEAQKQANKEWAREREDAESIHRRI